VPGWVQQVRAIYTLIAQDVYDCSYSSIKNVVSCIGFSSFGGDGFIVERSIDITTVNEQVSGVISKTLASCIGPRSVCCTWSCDLL